MQEPILRNPHVWGECLLKPAGENPGQNLIGRLKEADRAVILGKPVRTLLKNAHYIRSGPGLGECTLLYALVVKVDQVRLV
eukprot:977560-Alexandrium_andersonii.AAC.1